LLIDPVQPWDAIICTTHAGKSALLKIIDAYRGYLTAKGFTVPDPTLQLPVIPLGVHCAKFWPDERLSLRKSFRSRHALGENDTCVLCFGRLDPLTKAQPGPMIAAAHRAQARIGKNGTVQLFFVGQCDSPQVETDMRGTIAELEPDIGIHLLDGADAQISRACWHGADIFLAMSDNLQETFGLTVVEAMAAGLPVVAGDWSGYRDSVVNGETGTLVPTAMPGDDSHLGVYLADRYASKIDSFGMFVGNAAQTTSVDIDAAAAAIADLAAHRDLRAKMGEAGRRRANTLFDWRVVLPQYQELFSELASVRRSVSGVGSRDRLKTAALPSCANPYGLFAEYATRTIFDGTRFGPSKESCAQMAATLASKGMSAVGSHLRIGSDRLAEFMDHLNSSPSIEDLVKLMPDIERERVVSTCLWLAKYGLATISPERPNGLT
jgi:alpha-maltose-1-phosphate synthase